MFTIDEIRTKIGAMMLKAGLDRPIYSYFHTAVQKIAIEYFGGKMPYMYSFEFDMNDDNDDIIGYYDDEPAIGPVMDSCGHHVICSRIQGFKVIADSRDYYKRKSNKRSVNDEKTIANILKKFPDTLEYYFQPSLPSAACLFNDKFIYCDDSFYMPDPSFAKEILDCIEYEKEGDPYFLMAMMSQNGIITHDMPINKVDDIEGNYNDDFYEVNDKINEAINNDSSSIVILHGKPGTGKTTYLRHLIYTNKEKCFIWVDSTMFNYITDSSFIKFLLDYKDSIFILEDCESLLVSRDGEKNSAIQTLLSISDGILGDSLKIKFICTFNTDLNNIDKAILRKGRLKVKYEFKDLTKDKVEKIFEKQNIPTEYAKEMPLCDAYNFSEDDYNENISKIGF
jgi:hypothetical protein